MRGHALAGLLLIAGCGAPMDAADAGSDVGVDAAIRDVGVDTALDAWTGLAYDQDGPIPYTMRVEHLDNGGSALTVTIYEPTMPGPYPAVSFSCGSTQTAAGYLPYAQRLASWGIAMLLTDDPGFLTNTSDIVPNAVWLVDTWMPANMPNVEPLLVGLGGHSRGGAVSLLAAEHGLRGRVVAWFGLDPVDNQFLMAPREFARTDLASLVVPTAFLGADVISNCAPAADGWMTLAPLPTGPSALIVGRGAGHTQFEVPSGCAVCGTCSPNGTADQDVVFRYALRYFTAFFARELLGDATVGAMFEGAGGPEDVAAGRVTIE